MPRRSLLERTLRKETSRLRTVLRSVPRPGREKTLYRRFRAAATTCLEHDTSVFGMAMMTCTYLVLVLVDLVVDEMLCDYDNLQAALEFKDLIVAIVDLGSCSYF